MIGFFVERNEDDTLAVLFSDNTTFNSVEEDYIDDIIFGYKPDIKKVQAFSKDELYSL